MRKIASASSASQPVAPVVAAAPLGKRRRPSGEPPPLPRHVAPSTRWLLVGIAVTAMLEIALAVQRSRALITQIDDAVGRALTHLRSQPVTAVMHVFEHLGSSNTIRIVGWTTIAVLVITRRVRHLLGYLALVLIVVLTSDALAVLQGRMRPAGLEIIGSWSGYANPSTPVAVLAAVAVGALYTTVPCGRWRNWGAWVVGAAVAGLCAARLVLGVDHPTDVLAALGIGCAIPIIAFRLFTPDEVFPIHYQRAPRAHLDVGGERGAAIVRALDQQLDIQAISIEPFGLGGSAGSTPLRIRIREESGRESSLFAKLYAVNHLRSDRSYKMSRMILYGRLEDEKPFSTVRRLIEYEDHMLRLLRDAGLPTPRPYGLVEITPEREYVIVMEFIEDAHEVGPEPIGEREIDDGLGIVRRLWQAGVAHRDIKPSNLLVHDDGRVLLIDVAFATVRPTPWRQAADLANMMLTLALASDADLVYERATRVFAPEDVAEAFAACRSVTIPTQLRARLRADGRDLIGRFRALAPERPTVPIQLWTLRRIGVTACVVLAVLLASVAIYAYASLAGLL
jgi:tRNA A-37 threonylcarbamoyl transferase component Bud32/membrane-associated phospholipid phosphatase